MHSANSTGSESRSIQLVTAIPGPRSKALLERRDAAVPAGLYKAHPISVEHAQGAVVTDVDGNTFLDFVGGIGVLNAGHCPPEVVNAVQEQAAKLLHFCNLVGSYESFIELSEKLNALVPISGPKKTLLANSGAEAVENAVKVARAATKRPAIITFEGAYHGRTLLTMTLTSKISYKKTFGPFAPEVYRAPFPYAFQMGVSEDEATRLCSDALQRMLNSHVDAAEIAAIILEPVQGEGGFIPVPREFMRFVRALCDRHGILLIADEVQCGFGRSGTLFAMEQMGVEPDILVSAKSIAAGLPLAAVTGRAALMDAVHLGGLGGTYGGNPLTCVAALEVIKNMERDQLPARANAIGAKIRARGVRWMQEIPMVGDVRGMGGMMAIEIVKDKASRTPAADETLGVIQYCLEHGVITMRAGLYANCIRLLMPLVITDEQLEEGLDVLEAGLRTLNR